MELRTVMEQISIRIGQQRRNIMQYEDIWQIQDEITSAVNSLGYTLWDLHYDRSSFSFRMELNIHIPDDALSSFCSQMPLPADYEGEGSQGSLFTLEL